MYGTPQLTPDTPAACTLTPEEKLLVQSRSSLSFCILLVVFVEPTFLPAVNDIAADMSHPTTVFLHTCYQLIAYAALYPNNENAYTLAPACQVLKGRQH